MEVPALLKQHGVYLNYTTNDRQDDLDEPVRRHD
jgi:hypothetical protein